MATGSSRWRVLAGSGLALALVVGTAVAVAGVHAANPNSNGYTIANNTPGFIKHAADKGAVDPNTQISVTVWLQLHNEAQFDKAVQGEYTKGNSSYHKWLTQDQINASYSPTSQELKSVTNYLSAKKLSVVDVAENNWYVKVSGTVGNVEKAFHTQIDSFSYEGQTFRSNTGNPNVSDPSGAHIAAITGMDDMGYRPAISRPQLPDGSDAFTPIKLAPNATSVPQGTGSSCFPGAYDSTSPLAFGAGGVTASYTGNKYALCGYAPSQIQSAYNMSSVYPQYDGTGQTVVITDAFGDANIATEAGLFADVFTPDQPIDSSNFTVYTAPGRLNFTQNPHWVSDWQTEIALDVEWVHSLAPGAHIALVTSANNGNDLDEAINWAVVHHLGNVISNSWSSLEGYGNPAQFNRMNRILEAAAAQGIDVNFSSGDDGDESLAAGFQTVGFPGTSPYATSIGGTSLMLNADDSTTAFQTGWGTNLTKIANAGAFPNQAPVIPPDNSAADGYGFYAGAGGGTSMTFSRPSWQTGAGLPAGNMRMVPDVAMTADPYTGAYFVYSDGTDYYLGVIGGTSLACPMFSGIMAVAIQAHGGVPFGQAAPFMYQLNGTSAISDVNAATVDQSHNVQGTAGGNTYSAADLAAPLYNTTSFYSAIYVGGSTRIYVLSFGTDTSLTTNAGWDDTTGVGTPNGAAFIAAMASK